MTSVKAYGSDVNAFGSTSSTSARVPDHCTSLRRKSQSQLPRPPAASDRSRRARLSVRRRALRRSSVTSFSTSPTPSRSPAAWSIGNAVTCQYRRPSGPGRPRTMARSTTAPPSSTVCAMGTIRSARSANESARWVPTDAEPSASNAALALSTRRSASRMAVAAGELASTESRSPPSSVRSWVATSFSRTSRVFSTSSAHWSAMPSTMRRPSRSKRRSSLMTSMIEPSARPPASSGTTARDSMPSRFQIPRASSDAATRSTRSSPRPSYTCAPPPEKSSVTSWPSGVANGSTLQSSSISFAPAGSRWAAATRRMRPPGSRMRTVPQSATAGTMRSSTSASARSGSFSVASIRDTSARRSASSASMSPAEPPGVPTDSSSTPESYKGRSCQGSAVQLTDLKVVRYEVDERVATVTLDRPERLNAWTGRMHTEYRWCLAQAEADAEVRVVVVTGAGRGFCAGADTPPSTATCSRPVRRRARPSELARPGYGVRPEFDHAFAFHFGMHLPVIAAVNGPAAGVGLVLACFCDIRFAAEGAKLTTSARRLGLPAEYGLSWVLPRLVGVGHAADLLISSRVVQAEEAARMGLVNRGPATGRPPPDSARLRPGRRRATSRRPPPATAKAPALRRPPRRRGAAVARSEALLERDGAPARLRRRRRRLARPPPARVARGRRPMSERRHHQRAGPATRPTWRSAPSPTTARGRSTSTHITWLAAVPEVRRRVSRELPDLSRPRKLPPGLRVVKVARHIGVRARARGRSSNAARAARPRGPASPAACGRRPRRSAPPTSSSARSSRRARASSPSELVNEFKKCRDQVPPEPFAGRRARSSRRTSAAP